MIGRSILNQKTEGGQCYDDMTIVKTARWWIQKYAPQNVQMFDISAGNENVSFDKFSSGIKGSTHHISMRRGLTQILYLKIWRLLRRQPAYFCDLCETWNLSETASCFDVSLRVRLGRPLAVCSVLISGAFKQSAASLPLANFF